MVIEYCCETIPDMNGRIKDLDVEKIRSYFPILNKKINGRKFIYLDSAATGLKSTVVVDTLVKYYHNEYGKPNEEHELSKITTEKVEKTREQVADFLGAGNSKEIVFTGGCTDSLNIVAGGFGKGLLKPGDEVLISTMEHHANIIPWQMACERSGAVLKVIPVTASGEIEMNEYAAMLNERTKMVSVVHSSHVLGTILPIKKMAAMAHKVGAAMMADGAQAAPHMPVNMKEMDCDFYTMACHKMGTPPGLGILYGKAKWLNQLPPNKGGGEMARDVTFDDYRLSSIPRKFEAGTGPFAAIISLGSLLDLLNKWDKEKTAKYEQDLLSYGLEKLSAIKGIKIMGSAPEKEPVISFDIEKGNVKKLEKYLNEEHNIYIRAGELTAQPLMKYLGVKGLARVSFCYYNTYAEIDALAKAIRKYLDGK
jgi:cysteine desulfurase / selenocysteine lyase